MGEKLKLIKEMTSEIGEDSIDLLKTLTGENFLREARQEYMESKSQCIKITMVVLFVCAIIVCLKIFVL